MPKRASGTTFRCTGCNKVLAIDHAIKCPRCKKINLEVQQFATELVTDQMITTVLWEPDGNHAATIMIRKEIWLNMGRFPEIPKNQTFFPVFHVYNSLDPSKAFDPANSGYRVNPIDRPYLKINEAMKIAEQMEAEALESGNWVRVEDLDKYL